MQTFPWLTTLMAVCLAGAFFVWLVPGWVRRHARVVGIIISTLVFAGAVWMATGFVAGGDAYQFTESHAWIPQLGVTYALGVGGLGLGLVLLATLLVPLVILAGRHELETPRRYANYVALILALEAFMIAIFAARDLFLFYIVFEAMLIPVYLLIGSFGGSQRRYAAVKFLLYSLVGGLIMLVGLIALYFYGPRGQQGFLIDNLIGVTMPESTERLIFLAFFIAFAIKAPMFPVHTWLPDAAQQAKVGTSVLLVGVLDKVGAFGMLVICLPLFPNAAKWAAPGIMVLAVVSILYGALLAIGQKDILRMIAYTSVSHFGFMILGIFAFSSVSTLGSAFYMINHGLSTGALFLLAGYLIRRGGTQDMTEYAGLQRVTPVLAGMFLMAGLSAIALPGFSTFVSEYLVITGTFTMNKAAAIIAALGVILAALYILLAYQKVFTGPPKRDGLTLDRDLSQREIWAVAPLIALMLILGFYPAPALDAMRDETAAIAESIQPDQSPGDASGAIRGPGDAGNVVGLPGVEQGAAAQGGES